MSAAATEVFDRSPYLAPEAELINNDNLVEDRLFSIEGRVGVLRYNARITLSLFAMLIGGLMFFGAYLSESGVLMSVAAVPALMALVGGIALMLYTSVKRLHDLGFSGWYYLVGVIPLLGSIWVLYYSLKPGSDDNNQFGPRREATGADKVLGYIGIFLTVGLTIVALLPMD